MDNDKKIQAEMHESNDNLAQSLKQIETEIEEIQRMKSPQAVDDP